MSKDTNKYNNETLKAFIDDQNIEQNDISDYIKNIAPSSDDYSFQQDSTTTARLEDIEKSSTKDIEADKDIIVNLSTQKGIKQTVDAACHVVNVLDNVPVENKSKLLSFSMEFCNDFGVAKDSIDVVAHSKLSEDERKDLFVEVNGILTKTIVYDTEMLYTKEAAVAVSGAILEGGGAAHPAGWVMAGITGGSVYALGHVVATATSDSAAKYVKEVMSKKWDEWKETIEKEDTDIQKNTNPLNGENNQPNFSFNTKEQLPEGKVEIYLNQKEANIFNKEVLQDIGKTLPDNVGLQIQTEDNTRLEITVGQVGDGSKEAKIFDSKVFDNNTPTKEMQTWIEGVASMGVEKVEVNGTSFELKDANATVLKENLAQIPESSVVLSNVRLYPNEQLKINDIQSHKVASGDTFSQIAQSHDMTNKALLSKNQWLIDENRIEFKEEKILVNTTSEPTKENNTEVIYELDDDNVVSKSEATIIREHNIAKDTELANNQDNAIDTTLKAQEIVASMNLPQRDEGMDYGMEID